MKNNSIPYGRVDSTLVWLGILMSIIYSIWWLDFSHAGSMVLYGLLLFGEAYHILVTFLFWYTMRSAPERTIAKDISFTPSVDVFITVAGEPTDIVESTLRAVVSMDYPSKKVYVLNDGFVRKAANWQEIETLAIGYGATCITRDTSYGAKAGNINNGLSKSHGEIVVIFDADMVPDSDFLQQVIPYFSDPKMGFVQTPQYYENYAQNEVTRNSWQQQMFFFGPIMQGKNLSNAAFICGTNVAIRRTTLIQVGGMNEQSIAEDFLTSLFIHEAKWKSYYLNVVLARGLAPHDLRSYISQQFRWARGSLMLFFQYLPLLRFRLTLAQRLEYLASTLYYCHGLVVAIDLLMPLIYLGLGIRPVTATTTTFAFFFLPYILLNLITLYKASDGHLTFGAVSFSFGSFALQIKALIWTIFSVSTAFAVTPKSKQHVSSLGAVCPHLVYIGLVFLTGAIAIMREGLSPAVSTNLAWACCNIMLFLPFIRSAFTLSAEPRQNLEKATI